MANTVHLVWDNSREEHGEGPELVGVYVSDEVAREICDGLDLDPEEAIEEKVVEEEAII